MCGFITDLLERVALLFWYDYEQFMLLVKNSFSKEICPILEKYKSAFGFIYQNSCICLYMT